MNISIAVFERRMDGDLECSTLGLGDDTRRRSGRDTHKIREKLVEDLRAVLKRARAHEVMRYRVPRGVRIERVRLELTLHGAERRKVTGVAPIVVEPRWASEDAQVFLVYHPDRQGEALLLDSDVAIEDRLRIFFAKKWQDLSDDDIATLWSHGKERVDVLSFSAEVRSLFEDLPKRPASLGATLAEDPAEKQRGKRALKILPKLGENLTERAAHGGLAIGVPRAPHRDRLAALLGEGRGRPAVVVGPSGSGKTTLIHHGIADLLAADGYPAHRNLDRVRKAWRVSGRRIIAGMSRLGDWEKRCLELLEDARRREVLLVVDDLASFGQIGRSRESDRSLADFFRGPLARGELALVGECTPEGLTRLEEDAPAFASLFARLHLPAATPPETMRLMVHELRALELRHEVIVDPFALQRLLELGSALLSARALPSTALDLLRELAATATTPGERIGADSATRLLSQKTGITPALLGLGEAFDPEGLRVELGRQVLGQRDAVDAAIDLIARIRAGLVDPRRPYGVYLFTGPTGTGKTELAKCIAELLYGSASRLARFDMSELSGPDAPARLVGHRFAPEGLLTRRIQEQPFSLVLLDEIEKAHPSVLRLLLQLFEDGRLTDAAGVTAHFQHAVVIMTSNLGARSRAQVGFGESDEGVLQDVARAVREFFAPELFNRIDRIVPFRPLTPEIAAKVAKKELDKLCGRRGLAERNVFVSTGAGVAERIAREAFVSKDGARSVKRFLEDRVGGMLAEAISAKGGAAMQIVRIRAEGEGFALDHEALAEATPGPHRWLLEPLLDRSALELRRELPALTALLDGIEARGELARLSDRIRHHLAGFGRGEREHAEAIYNLDAMREAIVAFRARIASLRGDEDDADRAQDLEMSRFGWITVSFDWGGPRRYRLFRRDQMVTTGRGFAKTEALACIAEGHALARALRKVDDPGQHAIFVELLRAARMDPKERFSTPPKGLCEWLAAAYADARGELSDWASLAEDGRVDDRGVGNFGEYLDEGDARYVVLKIVGLCVLDFFELEAGTHVWHSLARGPEVVRVRVWPARPGETARDVAMDHAARSEAFDEAARSGAGGAANPRALLPVVRAIRFDPPERMGASAPIELEDYVMGQAATTQARSIEAALAPLWLLRLAREDESDAGA